MEKEIYLIIGASGVSGQAAIVALRNKRPGAMVVGTTSSQQDISHCDRTIHGINFKEADSVQKIIAALPDKLTIKLMAFIPAKGRVAMPATKATAQQIKDSAAFSIVPMLKLMNVLKPEITVCHSAFIQMPFLLDIYGAMNFTKYLMDDLAIKHADKLKAIRFGIFDSDALRGIQLLLERSLSSGNFDQNNPIIAAWKKSGLNVSEWLKQYAARCEADAFQQQFDTPYRPTEPQDITRAYELLLDGEKAPIINVIGNWLWTDNQLPTLPEEVQNRADTLLPSLDEYLNS